MGNRVGKIGAVKTLGLTRPPNEGGWVGASVPSDRARSAKIRGGLLSRTFSEIGNYQPQGIARK